MQTAAMVHSVWSEPNAEGGSVASSQVVWALRQGTERLENQWPRNYDRS